MKTEELRKLLIEYHAGHARAIPTPDERMAMEKLPRLAPEIARAYVALRDGVEEMLAPESLRG